MKPVSIVLGALGLGSLVFFYMTRFWDQVCPNLAVNVVYVGVLAIVGVILVNLKRLSLEAAGIILFGFALDLVILSPAMLYPAIPDPTTHHGVPRPQADLVVGLTLIPVLLLVALIILCFVRYPKAAGLTAVAAIGQLYAGFVCWLWAGMTVTGNYL